MQKTTSALLGALVVIATVIVIWRAGPKRDSGVIVPTASSHEAPAVVSAAPEDGGMAASLTAAASAKVQTFNAVTAAEHFENLQP